MRPAAGVQIGAEVTAHPNIVPLPGVPCGGQVVRARLSGHAFFIEVADVLGFDDWVCDESLRTDTERKARRGEIAGRLSELFATRTAAE